MINASRVSIISGKTGCGKSTIVPQIILNNAPSSNHAIVIQPRCISAVHLGDFVAQQRGDHSVGYHVRHNCKLPASNAGSITYCTPGILLRMLVNNAFLDPVTHLVVDEIHERQECIDFILLYIKHYILPSSHIKVILMSATMDNALLSNYFCDYNPSYLDIPVRMHEVTIHHPPHISKSGHHNALTETATNNIRNHDHFTSTPQSIVSNVIEVLSNILSDTIQGGILIFLPGWKEMQLLLQTYPDLTDCYKYKLIVLHSRFCKVVNSDVFKPVPADITKVVLSTNLAETSVTIKDISYVIDSGFTKLSVYEPSARMMSLTSVPISLASMAQRTGRAGRVKSGHCHRLYLENSLKNSYSKPEICASSLISLSLQIKLLNLGIVDEVMSKAIHPPSSLSICNAIKELQEMAALDVHENLTNLGTYLALMPLKPHNSLMILYGILFSCLDPIVTIACFDEVEPFLYPFCQDEQLAFTDMLHGWQGKKLGSDHLGFLKIFAEYVLQLRCGTHEFFCRNNFLCPHEMSKIEAMRYDIGKLLYHHRYALSQCLHYIAHNEHSSNDNLLKALIYASYYDNIVQWHKKKGGFAISHQCSYNVTISPESFLNDLKESSDAHRNTYVYTSAIISNNTIVLSKCSQVSPLQRLFFIKNINSAHFNTLSNTLKVNNISDCQSLNCKLRMLIQMKTDLPSQIISPFSKAKCTLDAVAKILKQGH